MRRLCVWWGERIVGELVQDDHSNMRFRYDPAWLADAAAPALSVSLPKTAGAFSRRLSLPFFGGLLPEEGQRRAVARALGVSPNNDFILLDRLGGEVAGAIQFLQPGVLPAAGTVPGSTRLLSDPELFQVLEDLPRRPFLAGQEGIRLSLAGAQTKLPVVVAAGRIGLPGDGQPTTHILKPAIPEFPGSTENEAFSMRLARSAGLEAAEAEARLLDLGSGKVRTLLLVQRYDRVPGPAGVRRLHQEDFCQALGIPAIAKYQTEGGPGFKECFDLVRRASTRTGRDLMELLKTAVFNVILGNADAHGKNFSLLHAEDGTRLAPRYDLMSTALYPELAGEFAMKIGRAATLEALGPKDWQAFAARVDLGFQIVRRQVEDLTARVEAAIPPVSASLAGLGLDEAVLDRLGRLVRARAERCRASL